MDFTVRLGGPQGRSKKMIRNSSQSWEVGEIVNVGFLRGLMVLRKVPTPGDYAPDAYILKARTGAEYEFVPHRGISRLS